MSASRLSMIPLSVQRCPATPPSETLSEIKIFDSGMFWLDKTQFWHACNCGLRRMDASILKDAATLGEFIAAPCQVMEESLDTLLLICLDENGHPAKAPSRDKIPAELLGDCGSIKPWG